MVPRIIVRRGHVQQLQSIYMGQDLDFLTLNGAGMVACTELEVREEVGRQQGGPFNGDDLGNAMEEVAPGETRHI